MEMGGSGGGAVPSFLPIGKPCCVPALTLLLCGMEHGPRRVPSSKHSCSSGLLLLTIQGPQICILADRVSLRKEAAEAVR